MDSLIDYSGIAALLGVLGAGVWNLWQRVAEGGASREMALTAREQAHDAKVDARLTELTAAQERNERTNRALVTTLTILVDHFISDDENVPVLSLLALTIRSTFPDETEIPDDLAVLLRRLDTRIEGMSA